jgi:hypothetical protein
MSPANSWQPCFEGATIRNLYPGRSNMQAILATHLLALWLHRDSRCAVRPLRHDPRRALRSRRRRGRPECRRSGRRRPDRAELLQVPRLLSLQPRGARCGTVARAHRRLLGARRSAHPRHLVALRDTHGRSVAREHAGGEVLRPVCRGGGGGQGTTDISAFKDAAPGRIPSLSASSGRFDGNASITSLCSTSGISDVYCAHISCTTKSRGLTRVSATKAHAGVSYSQFWPGVSWQSLRSRASITDTNAPPDRPRSPAGPAHPQSLSRACRASIRSLGPAAAVVARSGSAKRSLGIPASGSAARTTFSTGTGGEPST